MIYIDNITEIATIKTTIKERVLSYISKHVFKQTKKYAVKHAHFNFNNCTVEILANNLSLLGITKATISYGDGGCITTSSDVYASSREEATKLLGLYMDSALHLDKVDKLRRLG